MCIYIIDWPSHQQVLCSRKGGALSFGVVIGSLIFFPPSLSFFVILIFVLGHVPG